MAKNIPAPKTSNKKHIARQQKEQRQMKTALIITGIVMGIALVILGYVVIDNSIIKPNTVIAQVGDTKILAKDYQPYVKYSRLNMINRASQYQQYATMFGSMGTQFQTAAQNIVVQLNDATSVGEGALNQMIDDILIQEEAAKRGITVSQAEVDAAMESAFGFYPNGTETPTITPTIVNTPTLSAQQYELIKPTMTSTPEPTATATPEGWKPTETATATPLPTEIGATATPIPTATAIPTITPTPTVFTTQLYAKEINSYLSDVKIYDIDRAQLEKIFRASLYREKLLADVTKDLPPSEEQVWARHILVATEDEAKTVLEKLRAGEDWSTLAATYSTDTANKDNGGDLGWFGKGTMDIAFETAAFALQNTGDISEPVQTSFGWHIIQLVGKSTNFIGATEFQTLKENTFSTWLQGVRDARTDITIFPVWSEFTPDTPVVPQSLQDYVFGQ